MIVNVQAAADLLVQLEQHAAKAGNARYYLSGFAGGSLLIYGTDDRKDLIDDVTGSSDRSIAGVNLMSGAVSYAQKIEQQVDMSQVRLLVGHSLGASACWYLSLKHRIPCISFAGYRAVNSSNREAHNEAAVDDFFPWEGLIKDITVRGDSVQWWPWWNERVPWWCAERIKVKAPWYTYLMPWKLHHIKTYASACRGLTVRWEL